MKKFTLLFLLIAATLWLHGQTIIVDQQTKDTIIITPKTQTFTTNDVVVKKYKLPTTTPPAASKYLSLPVSNKIDYSGRSNVVIENLRFENVTGRAITLTNCTNVIIRNCFFNKATEEAISAENCTNVLAEKNLFNGVATAYYALGGSQHKVIGNQNVNSHVRTQGGRGNLVQFNAVSGSTLSTNIIENNVSVGFPGQNQFEDHISVFQSSGVTVRGNILVGGGSSDSGSGIMMGDYGGSNQLAENNTLLSTGSVGMGIAGGSGITIRNNKIFGQRTAVSNNPLYLWAQQGASCSNNTITGNRVNWTNKEGALNPGWNAGNCSASTYVAATDPTLTVTTLGIPSDWGALINFITLQELAQIR